MSVRRPAAGSALPQAADDQVQRLLESASNFDRLNWHADRKVVIDRLNQARTTRNDVMHFSPDPVDEAAIEQLAHFSDWIRQLEGVAASA